MAACPELRATRDALPGEAGLLERTLLGHVLDIGRRLDPVSVVCSKSHAARSRCASLP